MRDIVSPLSGFGSPFGQRGRANPLAALISTLNADAAQLIVHPLEYGSMFQDRAGTTPVTESGQLVGLVLDHGFTGKKPVPGPELAPSGTLQSNFLASTNYTDSQDAGAFLALRNGTGTVVGNTLSTTSGGQGFVIVLPALLGGFRRYAITIAYSDKSANVEVRQSTDGNIPLPGASGSVTFKARYQDSISEAPYIRFATAGSMTIDNISVRELPGFHAAAISNPARGVFRDVGGFRYIEYNGVNTAYETPVLPAPGVDKAQVFSGVRKLTDADSIVAELSPDASANAGALALITGSTQDYLFRSGGTSSVAVFASATPAPSSNVITGIGDISGSLAALRIGGAQSAQDTTTQGTGSYNPAGTYPLNYGARAGTSLFFSGYHYATLGPIVRFGTNASVAQIEAAEAYYTARTDL